MFRLRWEVEAVGDLDNVPAFHRPRLLSEVRKHLSNHPDVPSAKRKVIEGLTPRWSSVVVPYWQLKVDPYRVCYDIDMTNRVVVVRGIFRKGRKGTEEIL